MSLIQIDIEGLIEMRDELNEVIDQITALNKDAKRRIAEFDKLGLSSVMRETILNTLFNEAY